MFGLGKILNGEKIEEVCKKFFKLTNYNILTGVNLRLRKTNFNI